MKCFKKKMKVKVTMKWLLVLLIIHLTVLLPLFLSSSAELEVTNTAESIKISILMDVSDDAYETNVDQLLFSIDSEKYHVWGSEVLRFCNENKLNYTLCFHVYESCKMKIQTVRGDIFSSGSHRVSYPYQAQTSDSVHTIKLKNITDQRIAIVGANGYLGSYLYQNLLKSHAVIGYDRHTIKFSRGETSVMKKSSLCISDDELLKFDVIIYLGGFTGRKRCMLHSAAEVFRENVLDPYSLAARMSNSQLFLFASTSAVAEGTGEHEHGEGDDIDMSKLDVYSYSMAEREAVLSQLGRSNRSPQLVAVRLGSVIGHSESQRLNFAFMAMLRSAYISVSSPFYNHLV